VSVSEIVDPVDRPSVDSRGGFRRSFPEDRRPLISRRALLVTLTSPCMGGCPLGRVAIVSGRAAAFVHQRRRRRRLLTSLRGLVSRKRLKALALKHF